MTKPRIVCFCQPVAATISARVTPFARFIIAMTSAFLAVRSLVPFLAGAFTGFFGLALFLALGAPFVLLAPFFEAGSSGAIRALLRYRSDCRTTLRGAQKSQSAPARRRHANRPGRLNRRPQIRITFR